MAIEEPTDFGDWLKHRRRERDLTQEALAQRAGCSLSTLQKIEVGNRRPSKQMVEILAQYFGIPDSEREAFLLFARGLGSYGDTTPGMAHTARSTSYQREATLTVDVPNNLPAQLTSFVGRDADVPRLRDMMLTSDVRLLTLTGPPGTGKTRLALRAAAELLKEKSFEDGIYFVNLAPIGDPALVLSEISQAVGAADSGAARPPLDTLQEFLKAKRLLLMLDNFEQVAEAAPLVAELLMRAPRLKALVTSRELLRIRGERNYPVTPLHLPDMRQLGEPDTGPPSLQRLSHSEAIRLFIERAVAVRPDFTLTQDNARAVAEMCYRLDGLPLAIELAAARIHLFSPQAMLPRLENRLKLLTGNARDLAARQQTLRGAIEWSYNLLDKGEQQLFRRLAVFQGGRALEAVEAICNANGDLRVDVLEGITSLVEKNLLQQRAGRDGEPRFWMLETIHEYAREKLREVGEWEALQREHALYYMKLAEEANPQLTGPDQQRWLDRLDDEYDNIRAALSRLDRRANETTEDGESSAEASETRLRMAGALWRFWFLRGMNKEGIEQLQRALSASSAPNRAAMQGPAKREHLSAPSNISSMSSRFKAFTGAGRLASRQKEFSLAQSFMEAAVTIAREAGDELDIAKALNDLGTVAHEQGDDAAARPLFEESLALKREIGDKHAIAVSLNNLGSMAYLQGDYLSARALYEECAALHRQDGDAVFLGYALINLGNVAHALGDDTLARSLYKESLVELGKLGDIMGIATSLAGLGGALVGGEQTARGVQLFGASEELLLAIGATLDREDQSAYESSCARARALLGDEAFEKAMHEGCTMSMEEAIDYAMQA